MTKLPAEGRNFRVVALLSLCAALAALTVGMQYFWQAWTLDIDVYWEAGERMRAGAGDLYLEPTDPQNGVGIFIYPPTFAVLFAPLTFLPRWLGYGLWGMVQLAAIAATLWFARRFLGVRHEGRVDFWLIVLLSVFGAAWETIREGQVNFIVLSCMTGGLYCISRERSLQGGIWLALAAHLKIIPGVLLAVLIVQRRWRAALGMLLGLALFYFSPLIWTIPALGAGAGFERNQVLARQYYDEVAGPRLERQQATSVGGPRAPNHAFSAVMQRYFMNVGVSNLTVQRGPLLFEADNRFTRWGGFGIAGLLYLLALALAWRRRDSLSFSAACGLAFVAATLGNVLCWPHHLAALALLVGPLAALGLGQSSYLGRALLVTAAIVLFCHVTLLGPLEPFQIWGIPTLGVLVAWLVCFMTFWRREAPKAADATQALT